MRQLPGTVGVDTGRLLRAGPPQPELSTWIGIQALSSGRGGYLLWSPGAGRGGYPGPPLEAGGLSVGGPGLRG